MSEAGRNRGFPAVRRKVHTTFALHALFVFALFIGLHPLENAPESGEFHDFAPATFFPPEWDMAGI
ncbi:MAG: hypothetical protein ABJN98_03860 [Roseibium sp.]